MTIIASIIAIIINFFFPRKCYKLSANDSVEKLPLPLTNCWKSRETMVGKFYYDAFNCNLNERNNFGSTLLKEEIYGDCFIEVSCWWYWSPEALKRHLQKIPPHPALTLDPRLFVSSN